MSSSVFGHCMHLWSCDIFCCICIFHCLQMCLFFMCRYFIVFYMGVCIFAFLYLFVLCVLVFMIVYLLLLAGELIFMYSSCAAQFGQPRIPLISAHSLLCELYLVYLCLCICIWVQCLGISFYFALPSLDNPPSVIYVIGAAFGAFSDVIFVVLVLLLGFKFDCMLKIRAAQVLPACQPDCEKMERE